MNILIVKFGALGDVIRTTYFLKALYEKYDAPKIYWVTSLAATDLLRFNPYIYKLTTDFGMLKSESFDLCLSLDDETEILEQVKNLKATKTTGAYLDGDVRKYSDDSSIWFDMGLISRFGKEEADRKKVANTLSHTEIFSTMLGVAIKDASFYNSSLIENQVANASYHDEVCIGINSGAGGRWESKKMPLQEVILLIKKLTVKFGGNCKLRLLLLGGEAEKDRNEAIMNAVDNPCLELVDSNNSLLEFAAIVKSCNYLISSDSLALHMAISQGVANLSFYAPTSAAEIDTFGTGVKVISTAPDYCSYSGDCDNSSITAERLFEAFEAHAAEINL